MAMYSTIDCRSEGYSKENVDHVNQNIDKHQSNIWLPQPIISREYGFQPPCEQFYTMGAITKQ